MIKNKLLHSLSIFLLLLINKVDAQTYNIGTVNNTTINTCTGTLVDDGGVGGNYGSNKNLKVTLCAPAANDHIRLDFKKLSLELDAFSGDKIMIYDGNNTSAPLIATIKNVNLPTALNTVFKPAYVSTGQCLTVVFQSDFSTNAAGFEAEISCLTGSVTKLGTPTTITGCSGIITDIGGANANYTAGTQTTTICSGNGKSIRLDFVNVTGIHASDKLLIYDGNSTSSPLLRKMGDNFVIDENNQDQPYNINTSNTFDQIPIQSNGSCITLSFTADGTFNNFNGFVIAYSCEDEPLRIPGNFCQTAPTICDLNKFEGVTSSFYSRNLPGSGSNQFCNGAYTSCGSMNGSMSVENNSWVAFVASGTTANFKFTIPYCVYTGTGAQIRAFDYNGCTSLANANAVSTYITVDAGSSQTLSCTGLTPGKKYIIVIDGYGGNICGYTIEATAGTSQLDAGPDQTTCKDTTSMKAKGTGVWELVSSIGTPTISDTTNPNAAIAGLASGDNIFVWSSKGECANYHDTVIIKKTAGSAVTMDYVGNPFLKTTVGSKTPTITPVGSITGKYTVSPITGLTIDSITGAITPSSSTPGTYIISAPTACGTASDTVQITTCPTITPSTPDDVCLKDSTTKLAFTVTDNPKTYSIVWDATALAAGFKNVTDSTLPASPLVIKVPSDTVIKVYNGKITVKDSLGCVSTPAKPIAVTVKKCVCVPPAAPVLGPDLIYCAGDVINPITTTGDSIKWYSDTAATVKIGEGLSYNPASTVGKTYYYATQTKDGCESDTAAILISIFNKPNISVSALVNQPCPSLKGSVTLAASGGSGTTNWQFSKDSGATYSGSNFFNNLNPGNYTFRVKDDSSNCTKDTSLSILAAPSFTLSGTDSICKGDTAVFVASGVKPFIWNTNPASNDTVFKLVINSNTTITASDSCNTAAPKTKTVSIYAIPDVVASPSDTICSADSAIMSASINAGSPPFTFSWSPAALLSNINISGKTSQATFKPASQNSFPFVVKIEDNCKLTDSAEITITVNAKPEAEIVSADAICQNDTIFLSNSKHQSNMIKYEWSYGNTSSNAIEKTLSIMNTPGTYFVKLKVTDNIGCTNTVIDTFEVINNPVTIINPSATEKSIFNPVIVFDGSDSYDLINEYLWNIGGLASDTLSKTTYTFADTGKYVVSLKVSKEKTIKGVSYYCYDSTQITIRINDELALYIPNTFSPNNDGENDLFGAKGVGFSSYEMRIYDRWGKEVYVSNNIDEPWNGTVNKSSTEAKEDVYVYLIKVKPNTQNQEERVFKGHVSLIR